MRDALEIANVTRALDGLDDDEKGLHTVKTLGGSQSLNIISESACTHHQRVCLYSLILRSRKPEAVAFMRRL